MKTMRYKGYAARIEYSDKDGCFVGHIAGIRDVVGFHGESVAELRSAFEEAVDDYLETCAKLGREPQKNLFRQTDASHTTGHPCRRCHSCGNQRQKHKSIGC